MLDILRQVASGGYPSLSSSILGWSFWESGGSVPPLKMFCIDHLLFLGLC